MGWCALARSEKGISAFVLPVPMPEDAEAQVQRRCEGYGGSRRALRELVEAVRRYFHGWRTGFDRFVLDLSAGTEFQQRVWSITRRIPYGQVRTYRWIGMEMGRPGATRAIGAALGANPTPLLVPCHRVVNADGSLGGFSAAGLDLKAKMLELERISIHGEGAKRRVGVSAHG